MACILLPTYIRTYTYASRHFECVIFDWLGLKTGGANPGHVKIHTVWYSSYDNWGEV